MCSEGTTNINWRNNDKGDPDWIHILIFKKTKTYSTEISSDQHRMGLKGMEKWYFYFKGQEMEAIENYLGKK